MPKRKKKQTDKIKSDSDGVIVKRSYYSFSKYYPGGGSSQKYRRVMKETKDKDLPIKAAFAVIGLIVVVFIGYFITSVALNISYAPTTEPTEQATLDTSEETLPAVTDESQTTQSPTSEKPTESTTIEEPEREVNVTSAEQASQTGQEESHEDTTELFTGY